MSSPVFFTNFVKIGGFSYKSISKGKKEYTLDINFSSSKSNFDSPECFSSSTIWTKISRKPNLIKIYCYNLKEVSSKTLCDLSESQQSRMLVIMSVVSILIFWEDCFFSYDPCKCYIVRYLLNRTSIISVRFANTRNEDSLKAF